MVVVSIKNCSRSHDDKTRQCFYHFQCQLSHCLVADFLKEGEKLTKEDIQAAIAEAQIQFVELNPSNEEENFLGGN